MKPNTHWGTVQCAYGLVGTLMGSMMITWVVSDGSGQKHRRIRQNKASWERDQHEYQCLSDQSTTTWFGKLVNNM